MQLQYTYVSARLTIVCRALGATVGISIGQAIYSSVCIPSIVSDSRVNTLSI